MLVRVELVAMIGHVVSDRPYLHQHGSRMEQKLTQLNPTTGVPLQEDLGALSRCRQALRVPYPRHNKLRNLARALVGPMARYPDWVKHVVAVQ